METGTPSILIVNEDGEATVSTEEEEKYIPAFCFYRVLWPLTCFFKVHHSPTAGASAGGIPKLAYSQWATLFTCCFCAFLNAYDWELFPLCLNAFQQDLQISEESIGLIGSLIRWGNALSFPISGLGDLYGRKYMMIFSCAAYLTFTTASGFSEAAWFFTLTQVFARGFMAAQNTLATTLVVEVLHAEDRGWGVGTFSAVGILGNAFALLIFGFVGDLPLAWRGLYVSSGLLFLPFLFCASRRMPESHRFTAFQAQQQQQQQQPKPVIQSVQSYNCCCRSKLCNDVYATRTIICAVVSALNGFTFAPSEMFKIKKLIQVHELSSAQISMLQIGTGLIAFASFTLAGSLSDRYGRKRFLMVFNTLSALGVMLFFSSSRDSPMMYISNFLMLLAGFVLMTVKAAFFAELFSTSHRGFAQGWFVVCEFSAGALSLAMESWLFSIFGEHWTPCALLAIPGLFSALLIGLYLPEASGRDLEHVSPNDHEEEDENGLEIIPTTSQPSKEETIHQV